MKIKYFLIVALIVLLSNCSKTGPQKLLIANYPLTSDGVDSTGLNASMIMKNTPFQNGGIYCNGIYAQSSNIQYSLAQSPPINLLNSNPFL